MTYDIIGDVHGHATKLRALLRVLGYARHRGAYRHPENRMAIFLGDLIDRGPEQLESIRIVRDMVEAGSARCVMGNHELNAIGYATIDADTGEYLRAHSEKNTGQHAQYLDQVRASGANADELLDWFKSLPPFVDLGRIRVCHAWWAPTFIDHLAANCDADGALDEAFLLQGFDEGTEAFAAMEGVIKGLELPLPNGVHFTDHEKNKRTSVRVRWWDDSATTYRDAALAPDSVRDQVPDIPLPRELKLMNASEVPVFVGHYWLTGTPRIQNARTAIVDYSVARGGPLVAYRWEGEPELRDGGFVCVG